MVNKIYVIGSLRNKQVPIVAQALREHGYDVFDDWYSAGPEADDKWLEHQKFKGLSYAEALAGPAARNVFEFDKRHLDQTDIALLVLPAGKSGHLELGYCAGSGKRTFVLFDGEPDRWDVMYQFATGVAFSLPELLEKINASASTPSQTRNKSVDAAGCNTDKCKMSGHMYKNLARCSVPCPCYPTNSFNTEASN